MTRKAFLNKGFLQSAKVRGGVRDRESERVSQGVVVEGVCDLRPIEAHDRLT